MTIVKGVFKLRFFVGLVLGAMIFFPYGILYAVQGAESSKLVYAAAILKSAITTVTKMF